MKSLAERRPPFTASRVPLAVSALWLDNGAGKRVTDWPLVGRVTRVISGAF